PSSLYAPAGLQITLRPVRDCHGAGASLHGSVDRAGTDPLRHRRAPHRLRRHERGGEGMTVEPSPQHRYQDASAPIEERVASLLDLMTIEEKIAQLGSAWVFEVVKDNHLSSADAERILSKGIGHITSVS